MSEAMTREPYVIFRGGDPGWSDCADSNYQCVRFSNGKEYIITEPEDRTFYRDLRPLLDDYAALRQEIERLTAERDQLQAALQHI